MSEKPNNLREIIINKTTTSIHIQWDGPLHGLESGYYIAWFNEDQSNSKHDVVTETFKTISGLEPGQVYVVTVYTITNGVRGAWISKTFKTSKYYLNNQRSNKHRHYIFLKCCTIVNACLSNRKLLFWMHSMFASFI